MAEVASRADFPALVETGPVHFVGMGGAGMSGLAELVVRRSSRVTGCDRQESPALARLRSLGVEVQIGHDPSHLDDAVAVVYSPAVPSDEPELAAARARGLAVIKRSQALGECVNSGTVVAVAGTHGKTSTSALVADVLARGGLKPTALVGGRVLEWESNLLPGGEDLCVVEADEYDRSFHALRPRYAVITNLEADHLDIYGDTSGVRQAFGVFVDTVPEDGAAIICGDDSGASSLVGRLGSRAYVYGLSAGSQLRAESVSEVPDGVRFRPVEEGRVQDHITLAHPGLHSVRNALAAAAVGRRLGIDWEVIRGALENHRGVARRFEDRGDCGGVRLIDDYAHHPTEIAATLQAARIIADGGRLVAVFQPHLFTRTRDFAAAFGQALSAADVVWVTGIYPAREAPLPGVDGNLIVRAVISAGHTDVRYVEELDDLPTPLAEGLEDGDVCVVMGAGSIEGLVPALETKLATREVVRG